MRAVFDTNIFISALAVPGGPAEDAYLYALRGRFELVTSVAILTETARVLNEKFEWSDEQVRRALRAIAETAIVVKTSPHLHLLRDEPDNRILECALHAGADLIVTGDRHLLALQRHQAVSIVTLTDFLGLIKTPGGNPPRHP